MPTMLITGANRGLGLEWVRQFTADGWHVHATCRNPDEADELNMLAEGNDFRITFTSSIERNITDGRDDSSLGLVDYGPLIGGVDPK